MVITEIGGTVGDIESQPFLEAIRQVGHRAGPRERACYIHVLAGRPYIPGSGELQEQAHPALRARSCWAWASSPTSSSAAPTRPARRTSRDKIALFCNVPPGLRHPEPDRAQPRTRCPLMLEARGPGRCGGPPAGAATCRKPDLTEWTAHGRAASQRRSRSVRDRPGGQVRRSCTTPTCRVVEALYPRRHRERRARSRSSWVDSETWSPTRTRAETAWRMWTASSCPAASATAASRA